MTLVWLGKRGKGPDVVYLNKDKDKDKEKDKDKDKEKDKDKDKEKHKDKVNQLVTPSTTLTLVWLGKRSGAE